MKLAAAACIAGLNGMAFLRMDPRSTEFMAMQAVVERATELMDQLDRRRATYIANAVGRLFKK